MRFSLQIAAQAVGPPVFHRARLILSESSDRGDQFVLDKFPLSDQRISERSAKKSCRLRRSNRRARDRWRAVRSRQVSESSWAAERHRSEQGSASKLTRLRKPLFFGAKSYFTSAGNKRCRRRTREDYSDLAQRWSPNWPDIIIARVPIASAAASPKRQHKSAWKRFPDARFASSVTDLRTRVEQCVAPASGIQLRASLRSPQVAKWLLIK